jgi:hypothetical protein
MLTMSSALSAALGTGSKPVWRVEIDIGPAAYLQITDYESLSGHVLRIYYDNGSSYLEITEGDEWSAAASNEETAQAIADYLRDAVALGLSYHGSPPADMTISASGDTVIMTSVGEDRIVLSSEDEGDGWLFSPARLPKTISFTSGDRPLEGAPNSVLSIETIGSQINPTNRSRSISDLDIALVDDGVMREYLRRTYSWINAPVRVYLGAQSVSYADGDYLWMGNYKLDDISIESGIITLTCSDSIKVLTDQKFSGNMWNVHPIDAIKRIFDVCGFEEYDENTFDYTNTIHDGIAHWGVSRVVESPESAASLVDELMSLLGGTMLWDPINGAVKYVPFDADGAVGVHIDSSEIADMHVLSLGEGAYTRVSFAIKRGDDRRVIYAREDPIAAARGAINELVIESPWINGSYHERGPAKLVSTAPWDPQDQYGNEIAYEQDQVLFVVELAGMAGFCGTRKLLDTNASPYAESSWTSNAVGSLDAEHEAILLLIDSSSQHEFMLCTSAVHYPGESPSGIQIEQARGYANPQNTPLLPLGNSLHLETAQPRWIRYGVSERGYLGTLPNRWVVPRSEREAKLELYDVTIPVAVARRILDRPQSSMPRVRFRAPLIHANIQVGDMISFDHPDMLLFRQSGATSDVVWEVTSVDIEIGDSPGVTIEASFVRRSERRRLDLRAPPGLWPPAPLPLPPQMVTDSDLDWVSDSLGNVITA